MNNNVDTIALIEWIWPDIKLYKQQKEIIRSVDDNPETIVPAGFKLGKDFVAGLIALSFFIKRKTARVITTSVSHTQLELVLWGEINNFIEMARRNGKELPLRVNHMDIRRINNDGTVDMKGYLKGIQARDEQTLQGHHLPKDEDGTPNTLIIYDEASGVPDRFWNATAGWRHRLLAISNCNPCTNYFYRSVKEGTKRDMFDDSKKFREIIRIKARDSPNYQYGSKERDLGLIVSDRQIIPGVVGFKEAEQQRNDWDDMAIAIGLDAKFYEGAEIKAFPKERIDRVSALFRKKFEAQPTKGKTLGVDPAAGGDLTSFAISDEDNDQSWLVELQAMKTPDTMIIVDHIIVLMHQFGIKPEHVGIDAGGGGLQLAHNLRRKGFKGVKTINFGGKVKEAKLPGVRPLRKREQEEEKKVVYKNKRALLYYLLSFALNETDEDVKPYLISQHHLDKSYATGRPTLRDQMEPIPRLIDDAGVLYMLPKQKKTKVPGSGEDKSITLTELVGTSPDELESILISHYLLHNKPKALAGGF